MSGMNKRLPDISVNTGHTLFDPENSNPQIKQLT
jgi:hypothetical protein